MHFPKKLTLKNALCIKKFTSSTLYYLILQKIMSQDYLCRSDLLERDCDTLNKSIQPLDGLLALFHCADNILQQDIMCGVATCQLGIPFIVSNPFTDQLTLPIWMMRSIIKEWKYSTESEIQEEVPIITLPMDYIGGNASKSKSKVINEVISDTHFDHFLRDRHPHHLWWLCYAL